MPAPRYEPESERVDPLYDPTRLGFSPSEIPSDWTPRDVPTPFFVRSADRLFRAVERAITSGRIDARSEIGDAALDYREIRQEMADAAPVHREEGKG